MVFDPKRHLIKVQGGQQYLPVSARLIWFRQEHPDWGIETEPIAIDNEKQYAIFKCRIFNEHGKLMAMGTKKEDVKGFGDYIEKSETGSVGRALALCGYGTQFAPDFDESDAGRYVDSPKSAPGQRTEDRPMATAANLQCEGCLKPVTAAQNKISQHKYEKTLCPVCQRGGGQAFQGTGVAA